MKQKLFNIMAVSAFLLNGNLVWGLEKAKVYDVTSGSKPTFAADSNASLFMAYENPVTYDGAKAIRDSNGHVHSVEGSSWTLPGIWFVQSGIDGEDKWSSPLTLPVFNASHQPAIAVEKNGAIDLVMTTASASDTAATDIFFMRSADGGHTWSKPIDIASTPGQSSQPAIAIAPDNSIHVVWCDTSRGENHKDIYYSYSKDEGKTWGKNSLLPADDISNTAGQSTSPAIAIDKNGAIHVVWLDNTAGETHPDVYYAYKIDKDWNQPINLSHTPRISSHPGIACGAKGKVYVSWSDNSRKEQAADIWCAVASKYGEFTAPMNISNTPGVSGEPVIAADDIDHVIIVWSDTSDAPSKPDVYCRISNNGGIGFSSVIDLSHTLGVNKHPNVVIAGQKMLVAWEENNGASNEIKMASLGLKNIPMGPVLNVAPKIDIHSN